MLSRQQMDHKISEGNVIVITFSFFLPAHNDMFLRLPGQCSTYIASTAADFSIRLSAVNIIFKMIRIM